MKPSTLASIIALLVTLTTLCIAFIPGNSSLLLENTFNLGHSQLYGMYDSSWQRLGHKVGLVTLAFLVIVVLGGKQFLHNFQTSNLNLSIELSKTLGALVSFAVLVGSGVTLSDFVGIRLAIFSLLGSLSLFVLFNSCQNNISKRRISFVAWCLIATYVMFLIIPAFVVTPYIPLAKLAGVQFHYSLVLGLADRLAIDTSSFSQILPQYGYMFVSMLGAFQKKLGLLNFGQHILLVQVCQIIFLLASILALTLWQHKRPSSILFYLVLFGVYVGTISSSTLYPNQSGLRFIGLPLWVLLLIFSKRLPLKLVPLLLGCSSGFLLLFNLETGIALSFGSIVFVVTLEHITHWQKIAFRFLLFNIGIFVAITLFSVFFKIAFGDWPLFFSSALDLELIKNFSDGYGGLPLKISLIALLVFSHCVYVVASIAMQWHLRGISPRLRVKFSVACAILIWFAYYMNRPHPWNLWTFLFLYSFVATDFLNGRRLSLLWSKRKLFSVADFRVAIFVFLLLPYAIATNVSFLRESFVYIVALRNIECTTVSGVNIRSDIASVLKRKIDYLSSIPDKKNSIYLTRESMFIPLITKQVNPFDVQDVFLEKLDSSGLVQVIDKILLDNPKFILIDESSSILNQTDFASIYRTNYYTRIALALSDRYRVIRLESDWKVLARILP